MLKTLLYFALPILLFAGVPAAAQTITTLADSFGKPIGVSVDASGNVFVADAGGIVSQMEAPPSVQKIPMAGGPNAVQDLTIGFQYPSALAADSHENLFFSTYRDGIYEVLATGNYTTIKKIADSTFSGPVVLDSKDNIYTIGPGGVVEFVAVSGYTQVNTIVNPGRFESMTVDDSGNVFTVDTQFGLVEYSPENGYASGRTIATLTGIPVAADRSGNLFVTNLSQESVYEIVAAGNYTVITKLGGTFTEISDLKIDQNDNVYVLDGDSVKEIVAVGGYTEVKTLTSSFSGAMLAVDPSGNAFFMNGTGVDELPVGEAMRVLQQFYAAPQWLAGDPDGDLFVSDTRICLTELQPALGTITVTQLPIACNATSGVALDGKGDLFVADHAANTVTEVFAAGGYATSKVIGNGFNGPAGLAVDAAGNVFVADSGSNSVRELIAADNYTTVQSVGGGFASPWGVAVDRNGNLYVADTGNNVVKEALAANDYATIKTLASGFNHPTGIAVDAYGNVFVADTNNHAVKEIVLQPEIVAAVLPGARSVQIGSAATVFGTIVNTATSPLDDCQIALPASAPAGLTLSYQTTDPATNALTGTPDTPATIAGNNGSQSFLLSFQASAAVAAPNLPLVFSCGGGATAVDVPGVNTVDLTFSNLPLADIIALSATPSGNGIVAVPIAGDSAFAVASINVGAAASIAVSVDTGQATLPVLTKICQTDPLKGQCFAPAAASVSLDYASGATPTFSVFLHANAPIALSPATKRIFVRFKDANGGTHGSTSVAVETQ